MNVSAYRAALDETAALIQDHHLPNPYADKAHARLREVRVLQREAAKPEHDILENGGEGMTDQLLCACGWKSKRYWDGWEFAVDEWYQHVAGVMGLIPKVCVCGKEYLPADGAKACHAVVEVEA